jgi:preprotein translocase subunit SecG
MTSLIVIQLILAFLLVILVLLQGSDNEGLGFGGGAMGGMMSARGSSNLLSRLTAITATLFMIMSIVLTIMASVGSEKNVLQSLPSISSSEGVEETSEPSIPENN